MSDEEKGEDVVPWITKDMLQKALNVARRSVSKQDLERYMKYKRDMERRLGMDDDAVAGPPARVIGLDAENRQGGGAAPAAAAPVFAGADAAPRTFNDAGAAGADDDDDIYE